MKATRGEGHSRWWYQSRVQTAERKIVHSGPLERVRWRRLIVWVFGNLSTALFMSPLLRVKFDDHSFLDRQVDVFALRHTDDSSSYALAVQFEPVRRSAAADEFHGADDLNILLHFFLHADLMAGGHL